MKVKCIFNTFEELPKELFDSLRQINKLKNMNSNKPSITKDKEYIVYGIHLALDNIWYFLADDDYDYYPIAVLSVFFEITDSMVSKYWQFNIHEQGRFSLWPQSWINNEYYFDRLTDGENDMVEDFRKIKEQIDIEAN